MSHRETQTLVIWTEKPVYGAGVQQTTCPICESAQARVWQKDHAIVCREGHTTFIDGSVILSNGVRTTLEELRDNGLIKGKDERRRKSI